jgi:hypothetical protein
MIQEKGSGRLWCRRRAAPTLAGTRGQANRGIAAMGGFDRQRWLTGLILLVMALFVSAGMPFAARWRRELRLAAIAGFLVALAVALGEIARWLIGG